jgi:hypothetical protein
MVGSRVRPLDPSGLWAGLLFGILVGLFTSGHSFLAVAATGAALGAGWGAAFGYVAHARTKGQRDFSSLRQLVATHYDLIARGGHRRPRPVHAQRRRAAAAGGSGPLTPGAAESAQQAMGGRAKRQAAVIT